MKKVLACLLAAFMMLSLSACAPAAQQNEEGLHIVCTIFPAYDWTRAILGAHAQDVELTLLLKNGTDMHSYQPTALDMIEVSSCDLFIYVGGESDAWVKDALKEAKNPDMVVINLLEALGNEAKQEEITEGMETGAEAGEAEYDEHVWLSLKNAMLFTKAISRTLETMDAANMTDYEANAQAYLQKLAALDKRYTETVENAPVQTLLFGDRFPFRYLTDDYGLSYYAAFAGCSAETEASFGTIAFLADKADELNLPAVLTIEGAQHQIAETIIENTKDKDLRILALDSMQTVTEADVEAGVTYLSIMESNLAVLQTALA